MLFYLGTHQPHWLRFAGVPLFVSRRTLARYKTLPRAAGQWARDSGGFTELQMYGTWHMSSREFANEARRHVQEIGMCDWLAPQDWMCEPIVISGGKVGPLTFVGTKLSVVEHQRRTVDNYVELMSIAPDLPWMPTLQGWELPDYLRCIDLYVAAGIYLDKLPLVSVGSVCRRQGTAEAAAIMAVLAQQGIRLHGFGFKQEGVERCAGHMVSSDSLAWSFGARRQRIRLPGHTHQNCANCLEYALLWRNRLIERIRRKEHKPWQLALAM